ncbi:ATPase V [Enterococcus sp. JM4C]|uniref:V-type ATPase subunit n=1 Tax=Candidatus Enterococcus huntleyi TaxID=1857217 RepID=UPI0013795350|nr:V-type ATPase subunit [Enterococcus sp. JM4C]KAF1295720.1 ATPase V [Enterococcus sp. JM4C]
MKQADYHTVNPLIRGKELELLPQETFDRLIQAKTIEEVGTILSTTIYRPFIYEGFEHDFEKNLADQRSQLFRWLVEISPQKEIIWMYTMRFTFHNLKVLSKASFINEDLDYLTIDDGLYAIDWLKEAISTGESAYLPELIMKSIREVTEYLEESTILQGIDVIYDRHFLTAQRQIAEELNSPELLEEVTAFIDLTNISTVARGLRQNRSTAFMTTVLSSSGGITKETFLSYAEASMREFIVFLKASVYGDILAPALQEETIDFVQLETCTQNYLTSLYQQAQTAAFGPLPLLAFLQAKEVEAKNLRTIVVGKRGQFSTDKIKERMRQLGV